MRLNDSNINNLINDWSNVLIIIHKVREEEWEIISYLQSKELNVKVIVDDNSDNDYWKYNNYDIILFGENVTMNTVQSITQQISNDRVKMITSLTSIPGLLTANTESKTQEQIKSLQAQLIQLKQDNQQLSQSNNQLTSFAHVVSHDLKGPLRTINSFAQLLENRNENVLDDRSKEFIKLLRNSAQSMCSMIDELLAQAKIKKEYTNLVMKSIDLNNTVENVCYMLSDRIVDKNAKINCTNLPTIKGFESEFIQLFQNIICNALKFASAERQLEVNVTGITQDGYNHLIIIEDNGIGISEENQTKIFDKYFSTSANNPDGTGLGLYTCQQIAKAYGGEIKVQSKEGLGTTFIISMKAERESTDLQ